MHHDWDCARCFALLMPPLCRAMPIGCGIGKYRLRFEPAVELVRTGDTERDVFVNTQKFAKVLEGIIRKHPEQWIWVHARWKTGPKGG